MTTTKKHLSEINDKTLINLYKKYRSIWKVGEIVGASGQSIHYRLKKYNITRKPPEFTDEMIKQIEELYIKGFSSGDGKLDCLSKKIGKSKQNICRFARKKLNLTNKNRPIEASCLPQISERTKKWIKTNGHPKGAKGLKHSEATKKLLSEKSKAFSKSLSEDQIQSFYLNGLKTKWEKNGTVANMRQNVTWKGGWREIGGYKKYYRSKWEANYARFLELSKNNGAIKDWKHEPDVFWFEQIKRGVRSYTPDFKITLLDDSIEYHEVKGWMDPRSKTKIKRMAKYYPNIKLIIIDSQWFKAAKQWSSAIEGWE